MNKRRLIVNGALGLGDEIGIFLQISQTVKEVISMLIKQLFCFSKELLQTLNHSISFGLFLPKSRRALSQK